jgi:hypothetical protein
MLCLFAERSERDVGGWPVPYFLTSEGAFFCGYGYSVSDPILRKIGPGSALPHGTPEAGGFGLSVTEISPGKGMVVYWLQRPGGMVFLRTADGYSAQCFEGPPSHFKQAAFSAVGEPINLLFSEQPHGPPQSITVLRGDTGTLNMAIAKHGDSFSFSVLNVETPFKVGAEMSLKLDSKTDIPGGQLSTDQLSLSVSDDKRNATLGLLQNGQPTNQVTIRAAELDVIISKLGETRAVMSEPVSARPPQETGTRELVVIDPMWHTDPPLHEGLGGIILRLRHRGFGWLTFILPHHEARSLGRWLCDYENAREDRIPNNAQPND